MDLKVAHLIFASFAGILSAYLASRSDKNPVKWFCIGAALGFFGILPIFFLSKKKQAQKRGAPRSVRPSFIGGPPNKFWYYIDQNQKQLGPMSHTALTNAWREGKIDPSTYVWHEELADWKLLREFIKIEN